jgi:Predicted transcriptional regulator
MELDFKSIRALSSPTRVKILKKVMEKESTTTKLSDELGKSKSTISSHLTELTEAGLLEKDKKEGRRRVVYSPTGKAEAIVKGKERKVKFSVASSVFSAAAGTFLIWKDLTAKVANKVPGSSSGAAKYLSESGGENGSMGTFNAMDAGDAARETANNTAQKAAETAQGGGIEDLFLFFGLCLLGFSASALIYGLTIKRLGSESEEVEKEIEVK